jgi:BirA family biotin operon repressor/biotin-[acetyl-CoA-carboxylase] ligase
VNERGLLQRIARGEAHSGLERELGLSREALCQGIDALKALGAQIAFDSRRGYSLEREIDLLNAERIRELLAQSTQYHLLGVLDLRWVVSSTNDIALDWLHQNMRNGSVCIAEAQSKGRGRSGRHWISPLGSGCFVSLIWRYEKDSVDLTGMSLATGVAIARALDKHGFQHVGLKWPNDIFYQGSKLGGALVELRHEGDGSVSVVLGVGINYDLPESARTEVGRPVADLKSMDRSRHEHDDMPSRDSIVASLLEELLPMMAGYGAHGFTPWRTPWQALDVFRGKDISVRIADEMIFGVAEGIDEKGGLYVRTGVGRRLCYGGILEICP